MKKVLLVLPILLCFCGCRKTQSEYLISAIGFDNNGGMLNTCFEAVIINSETQSEELKIIEVQGETVEECVKNLSRKSTQGYLLSHCGVLIIGQSVTEKQLNGIYDFCLKNPDITLSVLLAETENAKKLLSGKPVSTISVGYDIMWLIKQYSENRNINFKNRCFEIISQSEKPPLPKIQPISEGYYLENY